MSRSFHKLLLLPILFAAGCGTAPTAAPAPVVQTEQGPETAPDSIVASAVVVPAQNSQLSFVISGTVKELVVREGDVVKVGQTLITLDAPVLEYGVLQAEANLRAAEFEYQYWVPPRFDRPPERRQLAEQELVKVQKALDTARAEFTQAALIAPFNGTVTAIEIAPGELVQPGQVVITLADLDHLKIETTDLSERDLPDVRVGQSANILIEAFSEEFTGKVIAIAPMADSLGGDVVYEITLEFDAQPPNLLWGMSAEVQIKTE